MRSQAASVAAGAPSGYRCHVTTSHAQMNDRLGAPLSRNVQFEMEQEALGRGTSATEQEEALDYIPNKLAPTYVP